MSSSDSNYFINSKVYCSLICVSFFIFNFSLLLILIIVCVLDSRPPSQCIHNFYSQLDSNNFTGKIKLIRNNFSLQYNIELLEQEEEEEEEKKKFIGKLKQRSWSNPLYLDLLSEEENENGNLIGIDWYSPLTNGHKIRIGLCENELELEENELNKNYSEPFISFIQINQLSKTSSIFQNFGKFYFIFLFHFLFLIFLLLLI
jgi:hypothetical protein